MSLGLTIDGSNPFNAIFLPLAQRFAGSLQGHGVEVYNASINNHGKPRIVFGAHSNAKFWLSNKNKNDIFVNLEPIFLENWRQDKPDYNSLLNSSKVLDYSKRSKPFINTFEFLPLPPFYRTEMRTEKKSDALFVGSINERRKSILIELQKSGVNFDVKFKIFGSDVFKNIEKSQIFLDMNFYEKDSIFNMFRFCMCAHTDTVYASEFSMISDYPEIKNLFGITISESTRKFPELVLKLLADDEYKQHALKIQHEAAKKLEENFQEFIQNFSKDFL